MNNYALFLILFCFSLAKAEQKYTIQSAEAPQRKIDNEYADKKKSPLNQVDFNTFKSLVFYPIVPRFAIIASFIKSENTKLFKMKTTGSRLPEKYSKLHFNLVGKGITRNAYQNMELRKTGYEDYLFLPFSNQTSGKYSYFGCRYIDSRFLKITVVDDFNTTYNTYCAYWWRILPLENDLAEIKTSVKKFHDS